MNKILKFFTLSVCLICALCSCNKKETPVEPSTVAQTLASAFEAKISSDETISTLDLAQYLIENEIIQFSGAVMPVEPGYLNGFTQEVTDFKEAALFAPMIGAIPFIGYIFKVDTNPEAFIQSLKEKADLRWNVCTQADEMVAVSYADTVFFVMSPISFEVE